MTRTSNRTIEKQLKRAKLEIWPHTIELLVMVVRADVWAFSKLDLAIYTWNLSLPIAWIISGFLIDVHITSLFSQYPFVQQNLFFLRLFPCLWLFSNLWNILSHQNNSAALSVCVGVSRCPISSFVMSARLEQLSNLHWWYNTMVI